MKLIRDMTIPELQERLRMLRRRRDIVLTKPISGEFLKHEEVLYLVQRDISIVQTYLRQRQEQEKSTEGT